MATSDQIGAAVAPRRPVVGDLALGASPVLAMPAQRADAEAEEREASRWYVRRLANRHGCGGSCRRPEHTRDVAAALDALETLGLTEATR